LTISREYARVLNGEIGLHSSVGVGSTFSLYLPLGLTEVHAAPLPVAAPALSPARVDAPAPVEPAEPPVRKAAALAPIETASLRGRKILVVEDDVRNLYAAVALLERYNVTVVGAADAEEAYAKLRANPDIDLILMDIMLPDVDGYQATREIRTMPGLARIPIIALSAKASESDHDLALAAGCNDFIVKPADTNELAAAIVHQLELARR
jgi:two-component system chemotaxis sensor kinase CheA